ncbi:dienelactone hydrolase family protein [Nonomuraea sp. NPDC026600]|uniref:dienelactone hydrolase family protein n=1 Tax=Nonomuraea sp. NPDC026600 TaxID=3155363 RepID=UPI0033D55070
MTQQIAVPTTDGEMPARLWSPKSGSGPGILLLQEIFGVSAYIQRRAASLAEEGYVVLAPFLYWRLDRQTFDDVSAPDVVEQAMALAGQMDAEQAVADAVAAFEVLAARDEVTGTPANLGFCMGGGLGFATAARTEPAALVSYYGTALPQLLDLAPQVTCPSLHHFGTADDYLSMDEVRAITKAVTADGRPAQVELYDGANHAFDNDDFSLYHPEASRRAWATTLDFLRNHTSLA